MQQTPRDPRIGLVLVGFSPVEPLTAIARHVGWPGSVLSDPGRVLYQRLGVGRASWWRIYTARTLATYARALRHGTALTRPVEDTRQLGADAVALGSAVVALWQPRSPDDRPAARDVLAAATALLPTGH